MENLIDINQTLDLVKLKLYNEWLYTAHIHDEGESNLHTVLTEQVIKTYVDPLDLQTDAKILDIGCGVGYFMDEMKAQGYTNLVGVTLSAGDFAACVAKGHDTRKYDMTFLPQNEGWHDESVDFIFLRHALEHSPYPIFSLMEYNRVLKQGGKMYIEVPAPDCSRKHEFNLNHYSILGSQQLAALLVRTGFNIDIFNNFEFDVTVSSEEDDSTEEHQEKFYSILVTKARPLDIK